MNPSLFIRQVGAQTIYFIEEAGHMCLLTLRIYLWMFRKPFDFRLILQQMVRVGVDSIPVAMTTAFFTGMVVALQSGYTLETKMKGISQFLGAVVSLSIVRELGPVLTAMVLAGRMGSAVAAEIGTMQVTEQVDALYTLAANPIKYLAVPRFLAFTLMMPLLTLFADFTGWLGGLFVCTLKFTSSTIYIDTTQQALETGDILGGSSKPWFLEASSPSFPVGRVSPRPTGRRVWAGPRPTRWFIPSCPSWFRIISLPPYSPPSKFRRP